MICRAIRLRECGEATTVHGDVLTKRIFNWQWDAGGPQALPADSLAADLAASGVNWKWRVIARSVDLHVMHCCELLETIGEESPIGEWFGMF